MTDEELLGLGALGHVVTVALLPVAALIAVTGAFMRSGWCSTPTAA